MTSLQFFSHNFLGSSNTIRSHQENMSLQYIPPQTPLLYRKTGVCSGIPNSDQKHTL